MIFIEFLQNFYEISKRKENLLIGLHETKFVFLNKREGLGFRPLFDISKALYVKLWWTFRTTNTMWLNFMWNKYCKRHISQTVEWNGGSQVLKAMLQARNFFDQEIWWDIKEGYADV